MADDRPVEDPPEMLARLATELEDLKATMLARMVRRPTGDVEIAIRKTPKPGTLFMQGQTVSRATYAPLWQWVNDNGLLVAGLFTSADGTTTFGLPNFTDRVPVGASSTLALGSLVGANSLTLLTANVPSHDHTVSSVGNHQHQRTGNNRYTNSTASHNGHFNGAQNNPPYAVGTGTNYINPNDLMTSTPAHNHTVDAGDPDGGHSHTATGPTATATPIDNRQSSIAINWAIWA